MLISAHDWDVAGAIGAGASAAYVRRPGYLWSLPAPMPEIVGADLKEIAERLIA
jgi:2-haloacid dehalogenase